MTLNYTRVTSIVTAAEAPALREMAEAMNIEGAVGLWPVPLSETGSEPATHYICTGWMHNDLIDLLPLGTVVEE